MVFCQNDANGISNSEDTEQSDWVSTVCPELSENLGSLR